MTTTTTTTFPTVGVPVTQPRAGESAVYRHPQYRNAVISDYVFTDGKKVTNLVENLEHGASFAGGRNPCLGERRIAADGTAGPFVWINYAQVLQRTKALAAGLLHLNLAPRNANDGMCKIAFFSRNRIDWVLAQQACHRANIIVVPLYDTLGADAAQYIIHQGEIETVLCGGKELDILFTVKKTCPFFNAAIVLDPVTAKQKEEAARAGIKLFSLLEIEKEGAAHMPAAWPKINPSDIAIFCYTSGTTGDPKGAMQSHSNILADLAGINAAGLTLVSSDVHLSYLPLAHMFEVINEVAVLGNGAAIGFFQGDTLKLVDDLIALRPTFFPSVPRLYNRIYDKIMTGVKAKGGVAQYLFETAYASKQYYLRQGYQNHSLWDALVFNGIRKNVGLDRVRIMVTGSAPIAAHVMEFLRIVFGAILLEGYGQTECGAGATISHPLDMVGGTVGGPLACNEIKVVDVPDMNYFATDKPFPRGELCYRGPNIFPGYYKMKEKTAEAIDADGWLHSGDIAAITDTGAVKIIDRKKAIFKLSQGEYVAAEKIENVVIRSSAIAQCFIYGDSLQSCLVAIIVVDPETFPKWAADKGLPAGKETVNSPAVHKALLDEINRVCMENKLAGFEVPKAVFVETELWTPTDAVPLLTPTFKLQRKKAQDKYQKQIDAMYATGISVVAGKTGLTQAKL